MRGLLNILVLGCVLGHGLAQNSLADRDASLVVDEEIEIVEMIDLSLAMNKTGKFSVCWKDTTTREPHAWSECPKGFPEQDAGLCYPPCKSGFKGVGPVCWEKCGSGENDGGVFCYEKGGKKLHMKKSYGRGVGKPLQCKADQEKSWALGFCYEKCASHQTGIGPVCWADCAGTYPVDGGAICCKTKQDCKDEIRQLAVKLPIAIGKAIWDRHNIPKEMADIKEIIEDLLGFELPLCHEVY